MPMINPENLHDGGSNTSLLTAKLREGGAGSSSKRLYHRLIDETNTIVQADGTISGGDKTAWATVLAFIAVDANFDKIVKKF